MQLKDMHRLVDVARSRASTALTSLQKLREGLDCPRHSAGRLQQEQASAFARLYVL